MGGSAEFDVIVFGATGYTGALVAEHLAQNYRDRARLRWAVAGRSMQRLAETVALIGAPPDTPLIVADAGDPSALQDMVGRTTSVITTAGPYQLFGSALLAACAHAGTDYLDLCGEPLWMRAMIDEHESAARRLTIR